MLASKRLGLWAGPTLKDDFKAGRNDPRASEAPYDHVRVGVREPGDVYGFHELEEQIPRGL